MVAVQEQSGSVRWVANAQHVARVVKLHDVRRVESGANMRGDSFDAVVAIVLFE